MSGTLLRPVTIGILALAAATLVLAEDAPHEQREGGQSPVSGLAFLAGNWAGPMWGGEFRTYYSTPDGGRVLSYSELRHGEKVSYHEFEKFEQRGDRLVFTPFPGGKPAVELTLTELDEDAKKAVFENPEKDFPTRIVYHRVAEDRLVITLSDPHKKTGEVQTFDLMRQGK